MSDSKKKAITGYVYQSLPANPALEKFWSMRVPSIRERVDDKLRMKDIRQDYGIVERARNAGGL